MVQYFQDFRNICSYWLLENPIPLSGACYTVQKDESLLSKRKKIIEDVFLPQRRVFGIYDFEKKLRYLREVPDRSAANLLPIIPEIVPPMTVIHSDEWAAYNEIANLNVVLLHIQKPVKHSLFFVILCLAYTLMMSM